ncbi:MAG: hypothetical protein ACLGIK_14380, partial [Gemmatimonadota bacterium]
MIPRTERLSRLPRIALYKPWTASMDEGWTRWVFDQHDVPYITLADSMVKTGRLRDQFDVVLVPDMSLREARGGMSATAVPAAYAGGLGDAGLAELKRFVTDGGTLLLLDHAAEIGTSALGVAVNLTTVRARAGDDEGARGAGVLRVDVHVGHGLEKALGFGLSRRRLRLAAPAHARADRR